MRRVPGTGTTEPWPTATALPAGPGMPGIPLALGISSRSGWRLRNGCWDRSNLAAWPRAAALRTGRGEANGTPGKRRLT